MITNIKFKRICWDIKWAGIILCFFLAGCGTAPAPPRALHYDVLCPPAEARNQLRHYFSTQGIRTGEATASDNKSFAITTDPLKEPKSGKLDKLDRRVAYELDVKPAENANASVIDLSRVKVESKGTRERDWHEDSDVEVPLQSEQQLTKTIPSICPAGH